MSELVLRRGNKVFFQNHTGNHPGKWDRTEMVVECHPHHQYTVKVDATGRLTLRNRQFLRKFTPSGKNVLLGVPHESGHYKHTGVPIQPVQPLPNVEPGEGMHEDLLADEAISCDDELTDHKSAPVQVPQESPHVVPTSRRSSRLKKSPLVYQAGTGEYMERQT